MFEWQKRRLNTLWVSLFPNKHPPASQILPWTLTVAADEIGYKPQDHVGAWQSASPPEESAAILKSCWMFVFQKPEDVSDVQHGRLVKARAATLSAVRFEWIVCAPCLDRFYECQNLREAIHHRSTALLFTLEQQVDLIYGFKE